MKKNKKRMIIFMLTLSMNLFLLFFLNYRSIGNFQMLLANGLYHNWAIELQGSDWDPQEIQANGGRLFIEHTFNGNVRTVKGIGGWVPPLMEGEFFDDDTQHPVAVVGERMLPEGGGPFIFEGVAFEVIGTLGAGFPTILDFIVLLNDTGQDFPIERTIVDTDRRQEMEALSGDLDYRAVFSQAQQMQFATQLRFGRDLFEEMMIISTVLITVIFVAISGHSFYIMTKKNNEILSLQGFTSREIRCRNHTLLAIMFALSLPGVFLTDMLLGNFVAIPSLGIYAVVFFGQQAVYFIIDAVGRYF